MPEETLRDKFAMAALSEIMAADLNYLKPSKIAERAYEFADAMMLERNKPKQD